MRPFPAERRRTFVPAVGVGIGSAVLCAVAGHQPWARGSGRAASGVSNLSSAAESGRVPAATALALVVLACWGVLLVTRGRVRRVVAALAVLSAIGLVVTVVLGFADAPDAVRDAYAHFGVRDVDVRRTAWFWVSGPLALVSLASAVAALLLTPAWPEMGRRYDAPVSADRLPRAPAGAEQDNIEVWKQLDQGRDPTA